MPRDDYLPEDVDDRAAAVEAKVRALLRRRDPRALALSLAGDPGVRQSGLAFMSDARERAGAEADALGAGFKRTLDVAQARRDAERLRIDRRRAEQEDWAAIADPVTGGVFLFNKRDRRVVPLGTGTAPLKPQPLDTVPSHETPGAPAPSRPGAAGLPGKLTEVQQSQARRLGEGAVSLKGGLESGFPTPGPGVGGLAEALGWKMAGAGLQGAIPSTWQGRAAAWPDAMEPLLRARTGASMQNQEFVREANMLIPQPGENPELQMDKAMRLVQHMKAGTVGLPQHIQVKLLQDLDRLEAQLPRTLEDFQRVQAGKYAKQGAPQGAPQRKVIGGRTYVKHDDTWYEEVGGAAP